MAKKGKNRGKGRKPNSKGFIRQQLNKFNEPLKRPHEDQVAYVQKAKGLENDPSIPDVHAEVPPRLIQCTFISDDAFVANATEVLDWWPSKNGLVVVLKPEAQQVNHKFELKNKGEATGGD